MRRAVPLIMILLLLIAVPCRGGAISASAQQALPILASAIRANWAACPQPWVLAGKIDQESGFRSHAEMKGKGNGVLREYGFGYGQITIAYNKDGSERFNNFKEAVRVTRMKSITWEKRFDPTFQLTYSVMSDRSNFAMARQYFDDPESQMAGMLIAYNAGPGGIIRRKAAAVQQGIKPPRSWFGGLENVHAQCENRILYGRPLWKAVNEYPHVILKLRSPKYREPMQALLARN